MSVTTLPERPGEGRLAKQEEATSVGSDRQQDQSRCNRDRRESSIVPTKLGSTRVSVVIPTLNEADNLPHILPLIPDWVHEVVVVDGHSTDHTIEKARQLRPSVRVILQSDRGKGNALACGFAAASGDIVVMLDADGSADPGEIGRFVDTLLTGADFAKGSRCIEGGGSMDLTRLRGMGNRTFRTIVNVLYGQRYTDLCYGYNAFWKRCLGAMQVDCDGFEVETLINVRIAKAGLDVREVPSMEHARIHGTSNLNAWSDGWRVLRTILRERVRSSTVSEAQELPFSELGPQFG